MSGNKGSFAVSVSAILVCLFLLVGAMAQAQNGRPVVITQSVDESKLVTLAGNTRPEVMRQNDRGRVADSYPMEHMMLQLKRSAEQERELRQLIDELTDSSSPNYHQWLTAKEFGERFGLAQQDLDAITRWLGSHGLKVNVVYENGVLIDFSGTAGQVRAAFHTDIHQLDVKGEKHIANVGDPKIPAALEPVVAGVVSLHDFLPHAMYKPRGNYTYTYPDGYTAYAVVPADLATIYNLSPLFKAGITGQGQTIVLIEDSDVYSTADWTTFRSVFGLSGYTGASFTQIHPGPASGPNNCIDPGANGDDGEAALDVEWASAAAPSATIKLASCASLTTFGGLIALQNVVNGSAPPALVSISYGECEVYNGAASNAAYNAVYQQAVTEGISVFVSAGDDGASSCSGQYYWATTGVGVSGFASTPYNVAVGGTDFGDTYANTNSTYWSGTNSSTYGSALSYVPEIPWNSSCGSQLLSSYYGYVNAYDYDGFCYSATGINYYDTTAGSGGPSGCATGTRSQPGIVSGTCAGWPKPSWQSLVGVPSDGVRDIPDVSLFAADGVWGHFYFFCFTGGGYSCTGTPDNTWAGGGGTSFSSPIMAGIQALVNQKTGERQGNPNPVYYSLAASEYGASGDSSCNSTLGNTAGSSCTFYDVTQGDMDIDCQNVDCYWPTEAANSPTDPTVGSLTTDPTNNSYQVAYGTTTGWDFATGIGTINAANLVNNWPAPKPNFTLAATPTAVTITQGTSGTSVIAIVPQGGFNGSVNLVVSNPPNGVKAAFSPNPASSTSTLTLTASATAAPGTVTLTIAGKSGSLTNTTTLSLTVIQADQHFTLLATPSVVTITQGVGSGASTITIAPVNGFSGNVTLTATGLPKGVTATFSGNPATSSSVVTFTASSAAKTGTATVTITGTSGSLTATTTIALTVNPLGTFTLTAKPTSLTIARGSNGTVTVTVNSKNTFDQSVTLFASGLPKGVTASFAPNATNSSSTLTLTASKSAATGEFPVTITGIYGTLTHQTFVKLAVTK